MTSKRESCHPERSRGIFSIASIQSSIPLLTEPRERLLMALLAYTSMKREELLGLILLSV